MTGYGWQHQIRYGKASGSRLLSDALAIARLDVATSRAVPMPALRLATSSRIVGSG